MEPLDKVIASSVILGENSIQAIDAVGDITVQHFVDLLSAVHRPQNLDLLVTALAGLISSAGIDLSGYQAIVSPKQGNALLGWGLAQRLKKPSGFVRHSILFNRFIETLELPGAKLLLVDDVSSEAGILMDCIRNAQASGYVIDRVLTVIDRTEGDAGKRLAERNVQFHWTRQYSDQHLAELVRQWKDL
jgi:orotate phosphoribosyltransferase